MKINLVYFSCGRDVELLKLSIQSVCKHIKPNKIFVSVDPNDPIDSKIKGVEFISREAGSEKLYGVKSIKSIFDTLAECSKGCDYVQKIDSDMLCLSTHCYDKLARERPDAYGGFPMSRPDIIPEKHFSGGTYFVKADIAAKLVDANPNTALRNWGFLNMPEDMVLSHCLGSITENVLVEGTEMDKKGNYFLDSFLSGAIVAGDPASMKRFGFAHCRTNLGTMKEIYKRVYEG